MATRLRVVDFAWIRGTDNRIRPAGGATVTINEPDGSPATLYEGLVGDELPSNVVLASGDRGRYELFLDQGDYERVVTLGDESDSQPFPVVSGASAVLVERSHVNVRSHNATGLGLVNEIGFFNAAAAYADLEGIDIVFVPPGLYRLDSELVMPGNVRLELAHGAVLDFSNAPVSTIFISWAATYGVAVPLTSNAARGVEVLSVGAGNIPAGVVAGSWVKITSEGIFDVGRDDATVGEIAQVLSVNSGAGTITLTSPLKGGSYTTSDSAAVGLVTLPAGVGVTGPGRIVGGGPGTLHVGLRIQGVDPKVEDVKFEEVDSVSVQFRDAQRARVRDITSIGSRSEVSAGYGVSFVNACQDCEVSGSYFEDCRHAVSINTSGSGGGGIARYIKAHHNIARRTIAAAYDTHAAAEWIFYEDNEAHDCFIGINVECPKASARRNRIYRASNRGIYFVNFATWADTEIEHDIEGNEIYTAGVEGIQWFRTSTGMTDIKRVRIARNHVHLSTLIGIRVNPQTGDALPRFEIVGNTVDQAASTVGNFHINDLADPLISDNAGLRVPNGGRAMRLNNVVGGILHGTVATFAAAGGYTIYLTSCSDLSISGGSAGGGAFGFWQDDNCHNNVVQTGAFRRASTPITPGAGTGHIFDTGDASGVYNMVA